MVPLGSSLESDGRVKLFSLGRRLESSRPIPIAEIHPLDTVSRWKALAEATTMEGNRAMGPLGGLSTAGAMLWCRDGACDEQARGWEKERETDGPRDGERCAAAERG
jgi:hypothetical protein